MGPLTVRCASLAGLRLLPRTTPLATPLRRTGRRNAASPLPPSAAGAAATAAGLGPLQVPLATAHTLRPVAMDAPRGTAWEACAQRATRHPQWPVHRAAVKPPRSHRSRGSFAGRHTGRTGSPVQSRGGLGHQFCARAGDHTEGACSLARQGPAGPSPDRYDTPRFALVINLNTFFTVRTC